jgi:DinB superfamily
MADLRYPTGEFRFSGEFTEEDRKRAIDVIESTPAKMRAAVKGLKEKQLDTPYRPGGWTVREVVHHVPDSHLNAYIRFKLALTEDVPTIKAYDEQLWAKLEDSRTTPIETSLTLLESLHSRMTILLRSLKPSDFARKFKHPERGAMTVDSLLALYAWHGPHHVAHITELRKREGWS